MASRPDLLEGSTIPHVQPLTRSSIKPRILFPTAAQHVDSDAEDELPSQSTPNDDVKSTSDETTETNQDPATPPRKKSVTTPSSAAASCRSLRSHTRNTALELDATPSGQAIRETKRSSPFDGWRRTKPQASSSKLRKRAAVPPESNDEPDVKKTRNK